MARDGTPPTPPLSRRSFLALAAAAAGLHVVPAWAGPAVPRGSGGPPPPRVDREHELRLRVPTFTRNGAKVPILVESPHPMTPGHHVTVVRVTNERDPISTKGTFHLTPASGRVHLGFQARMHEGRSLVTATAECNVHGTFSASSAIEIPEGAGGCLSDGEPAVGRARGEDVAPPVIRIPELVERGAVRRGELVRLQVKMRHPNRTGLAIRDGELVRESEPIHLDTVELLQDDERVCLFSATSALADDPLIEVALLARREGRLRVVVTNSRGERFEATHELHLA